MMSEAGNGSDLEYGCALEYEVFEVFHWLTSVDDHYEASISLQDKIIRLSLDDFEQYYTTHQSAEVSRCIFEALVAIKGVTPKLISSIHPEAEKKTYTDVFNCFAHDKSLVEKCPGDQDLLESLLHPGYLFIAGGKFIDPDPRVEFRSREDAIFSMFVATEIGDSLEMRFGGYVVQFTVEQALWLWFHLSIAANCLGQHRWVGAS